MKSRQTICLVDIYIFRYMDYRGVPGEIGEPHWFNSSMYDHMMAVNEMKYFRNATYTVIHGMNDDNVHFLNSARMEKALVSVGIDFKTFVSQYWHLIIRYYRIIIYYM